MAHSPQVGEVAPDFQLEGTHGTFRLSEHRGERVVLLFYPGDNTPVCTKQFCSYRDESDTFENLGATIVGISSQSVDSHAAFTAKHGLNVPLLADSDKSVSKKFGAYAPLIGTRRAVVVIDEQGIVRFRHDHTLGLDFLTAEQLRTALDSLAVPST
jgi:peroxiredoxin Q/BCP